MSLKKTIEIDGKQVTFKASAAVPRIYRIKFGRDLFVDLQQIAKSTKEKGKGKGKNESETDRTSFAISIAKIKFNRRKTDE